jgi:hypothetical protein
MLKVIGAGLPRTGTTSLKAALERLGFGPCYHMFEIMTHPDHVDRWLSVTSGSAEDWDGVLAGYRSTQDWPASHFWREHAEVYPDAKVLLTVRDPHRWYASFRGLMSLSAIRDRPQEELPEAMRPVIDAMTRMQPVLEFIGQDVFGDGWGDGERVPDEEQAVEAFHRHTATVRESLPADRLLVFDVRQGWGPLCDFLGVESPADEPFPHLNESETMRRTIEQAMTEGRVSSPFTSGGQ